MTSSQRSNRLADLELHRVAGLAPKKHDLLKSRVFEVAEWTLPNRADHIKQPYLGLPTKLSISNPLTAQSPPKDKNSQNLKPYINPKPLSPKQVLNPKPKNRARRPGAEGGLEDGGVGHTVVLRVHSKDVRFRV